MKTITVNLYSFDELSQDAQKKVIAHFAESNVTIIDLKSNLRMIYPQNYTFGEREFGAWRAMLRASGCTNVTPWTLDESEVNIFILYSKF